MDIEFLEKIIKIFEGYVVVLLVFNFVIAPSITIGESMEPSISDGTFILINKVAYLQKNPKRGDVVAVNNDGEYLLKRVVGLPGENILFKHGDVYINGRKLVEPYIMKGSKTYTYGNPNDYHLKFNEVFCMGDNREISYDSREKELGPIKLKIIEGKAELNILGLFAKTNQSK